MKKNGAPPKAYLEQATLPLYRKNRLIALALFNENSESFMIKKNLRLWWLMLLSVCGPLWLLSAPTQADTEPFGKMTVDVVAKHLSEKNFHVYDANSAESFAKGHVPGALHLPFDSITAEKLPQTKGDTLLFYCMNPKCNASHAAAKRAAELGYKNVYIMPAGIDGWTKAGKPTEKMSKNAG